MILMLLMSVAMQGMTTRPIRPTQFSLAPEHGKGRGDVLSMPDDPAEWLLLVGVEELGVAVALPHHLVVKDGRTLLLVDPVPKSVRARHNVNCRRRFPSPPITRYSQVVLHSVHVLPGDVDATGEGGGGVDGDVGAGLVRLRLTLRGSVAVERVS